MKGGLSANLAKTTEIKDIIFRDKLDLFGINETNLNPMVDTKTLNIPLNLEFERCDRPNGSSRGGCGVLIFYRLKYRPVSLNITYTDMSKIEAVWIEYISGGSRDGSNCNLYTPKSQNLKNFYYLGAKAWNNVPSDLRNKCDAKALSIIYKAQLLHSIIGDPTYVVNNAYDFLYRRG